MVPVYYYKPSSVWVQLLCRRGTWSRPMRMNSCHHLFHHHHQIAIILDHFNSLSNSPPRSTLARLQSVVHSAAWMIFPKHKSMVSIAPQIKTGIPNMAYNVLYGLALYTILASSCSPSPIGLLSVPHTHGTPSHPRAYALLHPHHRVNSYSYFRDHFQVTSSEQPSLTRLKSPIIGSHLPCSVPLLHCMVTVAILLL